MNVNVFVRMLWKVHNFRVHHVFYFIIFHNGIITIITDGKAQICIHKSECKWILWVQNYCKVNFAHHLQSSKPPPYINSMFKFILKRFSISFANCLRNGLMMMMGVWKAIWTVKAKPTRIDRTFRQTSQFKTKNTDVHVHTEHWNSEDGICIHFGLKWRGQCLHITVVMSLSFPDKCHCTSSKVYNRCHIECVLVTSNPR